MTNAFSPRTGTSGPRPAPSGGKHQLPGDGSIPEINPAPSTEGKQQFHGDDSIPEINPAPSAEVKQQL